MPRLLLTLATLALALSAYALMLKGWRGRQRRQADLPPPPTAEPDAHRLLPAVPGLFVGTTSVGWLDRVVVHRLSHRAVGTLRLTGDGVVLDRSGLPALLIPWDCVLSADVETALGGKVVRTGMLLITWAWGGRVLRTAFRCDDPVDHTALRDAITARLPLEASA